MTRLIKYDDVLRAPFVDGGRTPADGFDCFGLIRFLLERDGRPVADTFYETALDAGNVAALIEHERRIRAKRATADDVGAVVLMRYDKTFVNHLGLIVEPRRFVHALKPYGVIVCSTDRPPWKSRIAGFVFWPIYS